MTEYVVLDFETAAQAAASACALAMVKLRQGAIKDEFYQLIKPPSPIFLFTRLHGINWPMVKEARDFAEMWPQIEAFLGDASFLVAHNAPFDRRVLNACCHNYGLPAPSTPFLCTLKGARRAWPLPSHALRNLCRYLDIELNHHQALSDARAAARILVYLHELGLEDRQMRLN